MNKIRIKLCFLCLCTILISACGDGATDSQGPESQEATPGLSSGELSLSAADIALAENQAAGSDLPTVMTPQLLAGRLVQPETSNISQPNSELIGAKEESQEVSSVSEPDSQIGSASEVASQSGTDLSPGTSEPSSVVEPESEVSEILTVGPASPKPPQQTTQTQTVPGAANSESNLAFPGALGWAADTTTGGRGGRVVVVDSLSNLVDPNDGITTFREAMTEINEPRIIVFSVAGLIDYRTGPNIPDSTLRLNNSDSNVTIACQSAPPPGVTLMGDGIRFSGSANNVIMRHCRFRNSDPKTVGAAENSSCIRVIGTSPDSEGEVQRNYVLDHISCMWAADDPITFAIPKRAGNTGGNIESTTLSNSIVAEGDADSLHPESGKIPHRYTHSMGPSCASSSTERTVDRCSITRNFIAHNGRRNGRIWAVDEAELINNIVYNPNEVGISAKALWANHIDGIIKGNLIQLGPTSKETAKPLDLGGNTASSAWIEISGNYLGQYRSNTVEKYDNPPDSNSNASNTQQVTPSLDILEISRQGSDHLRCVGASRPRRDSQDQRVIDEFHEQSGQVGVLQNHERDFSEYSTEPVSQNWIDLDLDGMPDSWETKMGVSDAGGFELSADYTNLEVFLNKLALCPLVTFDTESIPLPAGTREAVISFRTTWETWTGGQAFEVCLENSCEIFHDPDNSNSYSVLLPEDREYQFTITPVGADGKKESIFGSVNLSVGL